MADLPRATRRDPAARYVLAIDTALGAASACLLGSNALTPFAAESLPMERGHAEALVPLLDRIVSRLDGGFGALSRVATTVGPGSFTGIRVGVAAARALGLACNVPVVGISTLAALAAPLIGSESRKTIIAAIDARHGSVYAQAFGPKGEMVSEAQHATIADALRAAGAGPFRLVGSGAPFLAAEAWSQGIDAEVVHAAPAPDIGLVARLALLADPRQALPKPLYLKPPDAKPHAVRVAPAAIS